MNYRHVYMKIISNAKKQNRVKGQGEYYEEHHILPKSLFPLWKSRHNSHTVLLTAREHFFCHQLLTKIYPCRETVYALWKMINGNGEIRKVCSSKEYEQIRKQRSSYVSLQMKGNKYGSHKNQWLRGKCGKDYPDWLRKKNSESHKNPSDIVRQHYSEGQKRYFAEHPMSEEQKNNISKALKEYYKNNKISDEKRRRLSESNKGKHIGFKHSDEAKEKIRQARLGVRLTEEEKVNYKKAARNRYKGPKIICVNTGEVFNNLAEIIDKYPTFSKSHIYYVCIGKRHFAGRINGEKAIWKYMEE